MSLDTPSSSIEIPQRWESCVITNMPEDIGIDGPDVLCYEGKVGVQGGRPQGGFTIKKLSYCNPNLEYLKSFLETLVTAGVTIEWRM